MVHRTNALLYGSYGSSFRYQEGVFVPGPISAIFGTLTMMALVALLALRIFHPLLRLITYRPGQGPQYQTQVGWVAARVGCCAGMSGWQNAPGGMFACTMPSAAARHCWLPVGYPR